MEKSFGDKKGEFKVVNNEYVFIPREIEFNHETLLEIARELGMLNREHNLLNT